MFWGGGDVPVDVVDVVFSLILALPLSISLSPFLTSTAKISLGGEEPTPVETLVFSLTDTLSAVLIAELSWSPLELTLFVLETFSIETATSF